MTEQNWATDEMYRWLSNDEDRYSEIMATPEKDRIETIKQEAAAIQGDIPNFTSDDLADVDWSALAEDFADEVEAMTEDDTGPRYAHDCNGCSFLGRRGENDLYWHDDTVELFVFIARDTGECTSMNPEDIGVLNLALKRAETMGLYHRPGAKTVTKGWAMVGNHAAELMELAIKFANPNAVVKRDGSIIMATIIQEKEEGVKLI